MLNWFFGKDLDKHLNATKKIKINGVKFIIKKIDMTNYLDGSLVLKQTYDLYKNKKVDESQLVNNKKIIQHFSEVLYSGVISPRLKLKDEGEGILIEKMFVDWDLVTKLYNEIMTFTYGKKKIVI